MLNLLPRGTEYSLKVWHDNTVSNYTGEDTDKLAE